MSRRSRRSGRSGLARRTPCGMTLLEVMLAIVLLLGAVMALSRIAFLARRHSQAGEDQTQAQLLCHSILQEMLAGIRPLEPVNEQTMDEDPQWVYSVDVQPLGSAPLLAVSVTVARLPDEESEPGALPLERDELDGYRLVRWVREHGRYDPQQPEAADTMPTAPAGPRPWTWTPRPAAPAAPPAFEGDAYTAPDDR